MFPLEENNDIEKIFRTAADKYSVKSEERDFKSVQSRISPKIKKQTDGSSKQSKLSWLVFLFLLALTLDYFFRIRYLLN